MSRDYRRRLFETAEAIALDKGLDRLQAREAADNHLRYAALKLIEGDESGPCEPVAERGRFMLTYGQDKAMHEQYGDSVDWWDDDGPLWAAHRIRVVSRDGSRITPAVSEVMHALGAYFVYHEGDVDPNKPPLVDGTRAYHFLHQTHTETMEEYCEWLRNRHYQQGREEAEMAQKAEEAQSEWP